MRNSSWQLTGRHARVALLVLGACTVWLVFQNTLLAVAIMARDPGTAGLVALAVVKASALVAAKFWGSPAAAALTAAVVLFLAMRSRPERQVRNEARHG